MRGLRMEDLERMTLGMWIDYVIEWNNIHLKSGAEPASAKRATQADFDKF